MGKTLPKAIIKRTNLRSTFNKETSSKNWQNYKQQKNICSNILKSTKRNFFGNLNIDEITDNKKFWETLKPFFTDKCKTSSNNILIKKKMKLSMTTKKFPNPLMSISQILSKA